VGKPALKENDKHCVTPQGTKSQEEKKLDKIRSYGLKTTPVLPTIKEFCDCGKCKPDTTTR
jgi:hypothetical protein